MKKRFLLPLLAIGAPIAIGVADAAIHMTGCQFGHQGACAELAKRQKSSKSIQVAKNQTVKTAATTPSKPKRTGTQGMSNYEVCLKSKQDLIEFGGDPSAMDCESVKNYKTPAQRIAAAGGQQSMIRGCEAIIKPSLKDPNSYRYLSGRITTPTAKSMNVVVNYTATNGFGGRVQSTYTCTYNG